MKAVHLIEVLRGVVSEFGEGTEVAILDRGEFGHLDRRQIEYVSGQKTILKEGEQPTPMVHIVI